MGAPHDGRRDACLDLFEDWSGRLVIGSETIPLPAGAFAVNDSLEKDAGVARQAQYLASDNPVRLWMIEAVPELARQRLAELLATPGNRLVISSASSHPLMDLPLEAIGLPRSSPSEPIADPVGLGSAELLRFVSDYDVPARIEDPRYRRRYRALVLVGDVKQRPRVRQDWDDLIAEVAAIEQALREAGGDVVVAKVTGELGAFGAAELLDYRARSGPILDAGEAPARIPTDASRAESLRADIDAFLRVQSIDVLHFVGHSYDPNGDASSRGGGASCFQFLLPGTVEGGPPIEVDYPATRLAAALPDGGLRLVTTSACYGGSTLGRALCRAAEHVVVTSARVSTDFTRRFATALYAALLRERTSIGAAVRAGRRELGAAQRWIPQHFARTLDDGAFRPNPWRAWLEQQEQKLHHFDGIHRRWFGATHGALDLLHVEVHIEGHGKHRGDLDLETAGPHHGLGEDPRPRPRDPRGWSLEELLDLTSNHYPWVTGRWVLFGDAGTGKSTTLRHLTRRLAQSGRHLPVYLRLTEWARQPDPRAFWDQLFPPGADFRAEDLRVFLDGLDELDDPARASDLVSLVPLGAKIVVASRRSADVSDLPGRFVACALKKLDEDQCRRLIQNVLTAELAELEAKKSPIPDTLTGSIEASNRKLHDLLSGQLRREAEVPLFVTLAAHLWAGGKPPTTAGRLPFYLQCIEFLLFAQHRPNSAANGPHLLGAKGPGLWFARLVALEFLLGGSAALDELIDQATLGDWIEVLEARGAPYAALIQGCDIRKRVKQGRTATATGVDLVGHSPDSLLAGLVSGALLQQDGGEWRWTHKTLYEALVAHLLVEYGKRVDKEALARVAAALIEVVQAPASALAEIFGLVGLSLPSRDARDAWVGKVVEVERSRNLAGRLATRVLSLGVDVGPEVAADVLGTSGDWEARHEEYKKFEPRDSDELRAWLMALVGHVHEPDGFLRMRDLGWILERARPRSASADELAIFEAVCDAVMSLLPTPDLTAALGFDARIGSTWSDDQDPDDTELARVRTREAPLRSHRAHPIQAAAMSEPFWRQIDGTGPNGFAMGADVDDDGNPDEEPPEQPVALSAFRISSVTVTRSLYDLFDPPHEHARSDRPDVPATRVTWYEAKLFCAWASHRLRAAGVPLATDLDLPTEAQWEYACREAGRSGHGSRYHTGRTEADLTRAGWYRGSYYGTGGRRVMPVGQLTPNALGLWDMHGNVLEWCRDWLAERLPGGRDPLGPPHGTNRVLRGGSIHDDPRGCRASCRGGWWPQYDVDLVVVGFRLVAPSS